MCGRLTRACSKYPGSIGEGDFSDARSGSLISAGGSPGELYRGPIDRAPESEPGLYQSGGPSHLSRQPARAHRPFPRAVGLRGLSGMPPARQHSSRSGGPDSGVRRRLSTFARVISTLVAVRMSSGPPLILAHPWLIC
ncbi:MAG: hypothetical protein ACXAEL_13610 [Candidatus Hodarchaeales archaeon]